MAFNAGLLKNVRVDGGMSRQQLANELSITESHLYMLENGVRQPSLTMLKKIADTTGVPPGAYLDSEITQLSPNVIEVYMKYPNMAFIKELNQTREEKYRAENNNIIAGQLIEHLLTVITLFSGYRDILTFYVKQSDELDEEIQQLALKSLKEDGTHFDTLCKVLQIKPTKLKQWFGMEKVLFKCKFDLKEPVEVASSKEAGLAFVCFECSFKESGACTGYGENIQPETLLEVLEALREAGVNARKEQARFLEEHYGISHTPQEITEYAHRGKCGKHIPEGVLNMEEYKGS